MEVELKMTYKQIETSREIRLWITRVLLPAFGIALMFPEYRESVVTNVKKIKNKFKSKLQK